jgi:putative flippase GtrA
MTISTAGQEFLPAFPFESPPVPTQLRAVPSETATRAAGACSPRRGLVQRLSRCMSVSLITTVISVTTLVVATAGLGVTAWIANIMATSLATIPSYHLNRRWTWGKKDASNFRREVLPFWTLSFAGLVLSTIAVAITDSSGLAAGMPTPLLRTGAVLAAHVSGFALLWVAQFILLERVLFAD